MAITLLTVVSKHIFFGAVDGHHVSYQQRIAGERAPAWEKPFSHLLSPYDYFILTRSLPLDALSWSSHERAQRRTDTDLTHQLLFSSRTDGASWQIFANRITHQGATLVIIKTKEGTILGGYADEPWQPATDWYGSSSNYLFRISTNGRLPMDTWGGGSGSNNNFQYLNWGKKSLPNGLAMGGQFDYPGLWLDSDFVHGQSNAGPVCTTYQSPQLTETSDFLVDEVEAILVRPIIRDDSLEGAGGGGGVLSRAEDMEFMEMAGKKMYSKDLGEPEHEEDDSNK
ncbi:TLD-domain-containing protein [Dichotomocladium elegans]|nr:TLD-domain-containing protein [Dichotomocladium elegans]